jgi:hypothetical protein
MRILCDYLVVIGFLTKDGDRYGLTPDSAMFLDRRSPTCLATTVRFLASPMLTEGFKTSRPRCAKAVRWSVKREPWRRSTPFGWSLRAPWRR